MDKSVKYPPDHQNTEEDYERFDHVMELAKQIFDNKIEGVILIAKVDDQADNGASTKIDGLARVNAVTPYNIFKLVGKLGLTPDRLEELTMVEKMRASKQDKYNQ